jgi:hypothetical protein
VLEAHRTEAISYEVRSRARVGVVLRKRADARHAQQREVILETLLAGTLDERIEVGEVTFADSICRGQRLVVYAG